MGEPVGTKLLRNIPLFSMLSNDELVKILLAPGNGIEKYAKNTTIIREFEAGKCMYVILEGELDVLISGGGNIQQTRIAKLRSGDFFGEQALLPGGTGRRNATIKTQRETKVFRIDKEYVLLCVKNQTAEKTKSHTLDAILESDNIRLLLKKLRLFQSLNQNEWATINSWTEIIELSAGEFAVKKFQVGNHFYVVLEGNVEVFILGTQGESLVLAQLTIGQFFGEQALMPENINKRNAFVRAPKKVKLIKISKNYFKLILSRDKKVAEKLKNIHLTRQQHIKRLLNS